MASWTHAWGSLVGLGIATLTLGAGCSSAPDEEAKTADAPLVEVCQPLITSSLDFACQREPLGVSELVSSAYGTCGGCAVGVVSTIATGGASLFMLTLTGAGCYGCAVWLESRLGPYDCNPIADEAVACQGACRSVGYSYATLTAGTAQGSTDVSCACGTSASANVCCSVGNPAGQNGQRVCDPSTVGPTNPGTNGGGTATPQAPTACYAPYDSSAPNCRTSFTQPTCSTTTSLYDAMPVGGEMSADLVMCSPTQNGCGRVYNSCRYSTSFTDHKCVKNYDGLADYCK